MKLPSIRTLFLGAILSGFFLLAVAGMDPQPSVAQQPMYTFTGCRFTPSSINPIEYRFYSVTSNTRIAFNAGAAAWNAAPVPGYFQHTPWFPDPQIKVYDNSYSGVDWAGRMIYRGCDNGIWAGNDVDIEFNLHLEPSSLVLKKNIAIHEMGHAYGLDHVGTLEDNELICAAMLPYLSNCGNFQRIMKLWESTYFTDETNTTTF